MLGFQEEHRGCILLGSWRGNTNSLGPGVQQREMLGDYFAASFVPGRRWSTWGSRERHHSSWLCPLSGMGNTAGNNTWAVLG